MKAEKMVSKIVILAICLIWAEVDGTSISSLEQCAMSYYGTVMPSYGMEMSSYDIGTSSDGVAMSYDSMSMSSDAIPVSSDMESSSDGVAMSYDSMLMSSDAIPVSSDYMLMSSDSMLMSSDSMLMSSDSMSILTETMSMSSDPIPMSSDPIAMSSASLSILLDTLSTTSDSMPMSSDSMSMLPDAMSISFSFHYDPSKTQYMTDSEGNTVCYIPPMTFSEDMPLLESSSDMPLMESSSDMPPMTSSSDMLPMESSSDMPLLESSSDMPPMESSSDMPPMTSSSDMLPMESSSDMPLLESSSDMPPMESSSDMPPMTSSSDMLPMESSSDMLLMESLSDMPPMESSSDMPPMESSSDMPPMESSSNMPPMESSSDMPPMESSSDMPPMTSSSDMPLLESSSDMPLLESSSDMPPMESSSDMPPMESSSDMPLLESSSNMPPMESSSDMPLLESSSDMPLLESSSDIPPMVSSSDMPPMESSSDMPLLESSSDMPPMESSSDVPPMESSSDMPPMESSSDMPLMESSSDMPPMSSSSDILLMESSSDMPLLESSSDMPPMTSASDMPLLESSSDMPLLESSSDMPPMESSSDMPPMESSSDMPPMESSSDMQPMESSSSPTSDMLQSIQSSMTLSASQASSTTPPMSMSSSMNVSDKHVPISFISSSSSSSYQPHSQSLMSESYQPPMSGSYPPLSQPPMSVSYQPSVSGSYPPPSQPPMSDSYLPSVSGSYPPPSQSPMSDSYLPSVSESYPPPSQPPMSVSYQPSVSGSYPPPSQPPMSVSYQPSVSGSYPTPSQPPMSDSYLPSVSGSYPPPSQSPMSDSYQPSVSESYPPPSQPPMSDSYQPSVSGSFPPPSQPPMSDSYLPSVPGSYPPPSQPPMSDSYQPSVSGSYPPPSQPPMSDSYQPSVSGSYPPPSHSIMSDSYQPSVSESYPPPSKSPMSDSYLPSMSGSYPPSSHSIMPGSYSPPNPSSKSESYPSFSQSSYSVPNLSLDQSSMSESYPIPSKSPIYDSFPSSMSGSYPTPSQPPMSDSYQPSVSGLYPPPIKSPMSDSYLPSVSESSAPPSQPPMSDSYQPSVSYPTPSQSPIYDSFKPSMSESYPPPIKSPMSDSYLPSVSESYPPPSQPPMSDSYQPSMSGSYPPSSQQPMSDSYLPSVSGSYPPPSQSPMSDSYLPSVSYPTRSQSPIYDSFKPSMSESYPPPIKSPMSDSYLPSVSGSYPPSSQQPMSDSYLPSVSYPTQSQSPIYDSFKPSMSESYPPPSQPPMSDSYLPSVSESYPPPSQPPMSDSYQPSMSGSYPPSSQQPMSQSSNSYIMMSESVTPTPSLSNALMDANMTTHFSMEESASDLSVQPTPSSSMEMSSSVVVPSCVGTVDCAGVCNGRNVLDSDCNVCYGPQGNYSKVSEFKDCNSSCFGSASINKCGFCTGGNTSKADTEGVDTCSGVCTNNPKYINPVDCNGDCNGTAFIDVSCSGVCMGGNTGILKNHSRDCSNICNGTNELDSCGFCTVPFNGTTGSLYKDCSGTCMTPATLKNGAIKNKCDNCVGGNTGKALTYGQDECGICGGNNSTCTDCNGTPNGGKVNDACDVCGGDGTTCDVVISISPEYAPSVTESTIDLIGAGFRTTSSRTCYIKKTGVSNIALTVTSVVSTQKQVVTIPKNVAAGTYKIDCISGSDMSAATIDLIVYDSTGVSLTSVSPATFIKGATTDTQVLTLNGTGFIQNSTYCIIVTGGSAESVIKATWADSTSAACTINHPAKSQTMQVYLSLNGRYRHTPAKTVTAQAAAPTATASFNGRNGAEVTIKFSLKVNTSSFSDCSNIFDTASVTALGSNAQCKPVSGTKLLIRGTSLALSSSLTPKADAIKQAGEQEALPLNTAIVVTTPTNVVQPKVKIRGPNEVGSCDNDIFIRANTIGGAGRDITYSWTVNPNTPTIGSNSSQKTTVTNLNPGTYTFSVDATNFFSATGSGTKTVVKKSVSLPKLFVTSTGGETVLVSESFDLIANAKLIKGCADDTLTFSWSFSGGVTADTIQKTRQRYTVAANTLPAGQTITATVTVALESKPGDTIEGNAVFTTEYPPLNARIKGASTRTIGVDGGSLVLDASISVDPSNLGDMTYSWQCEQIENNVASGCLSSDGNAFPSSTTDDFTFNANKLLPEKQYRFTVTTQSGSRVSQASVVINSIAGNPPKVVMSEIRNGGYIEKSDTVKLDALITLPSPGASIVSIVWESVQDSGQGSVDLTNPSNLAIQGKKIDLNNIKVLGIISIKGGIMEKGEKYTIQATITDNSNNVIVGSVDINVYTGVKSCLLEPISSYSAMSQVDVTVQQCMTDSEGGTLTYKLFVKTNNNGGLLALTDNLITNTLTVPYGPKAYTGSTNVFIVQVCAKKGGCMELTSDPVTVTSISPAQLEAAKTSVLDAAADFKKTADPLKGAVMVGVFLESSTLTSSRRKRSVTTDSIHASLLDLIAASLTGATKTKDRITTIMDVLCTIKVASVSDVDLATVIGNFNETVSFMDENSFAVSKKHAECFFVFNKNVKTRGLNGDYIETKIISSIAKGFIYGDVEVLSMANEYDTKHSEEIPSSTYSTGATTNPVQVDFGSTLTSQYGSWACSSGTCSGVLIKSQHYATTLDPFSTAAKDISDRGSDVLNLELLDPLNGEVITGITNLATPITLKFPVTKPINGATYKCKYWDVGTSTWKDDGVTTSTQTTSQVDCTSDHLTSFAVFKAEVASENTDDESPPNNNLAAIIGGTIAGIIMLAFIAIVIVLIVKKKQEDAKVSSRENLREEEMVGS